MKKILVSLLLLAVTAFAYADTGEERTKFEDESGTISEAFRALTFNDEIILDNLDGTGSIDITLLGDVRYLKLDASNDPITEDLELLKNLVLPVSTATAGIYYAGSNHFLHNFGTDNLFIGINAGNLTLSGADSNTGIGTNALDALTSGDNNFALGTDSLGTTTTGGHNIAIGPNTLAQNISGTSNIAIGSAALGTQTDVSNNIAIGHNAGLNWASGDSNQVAIGYQAGRDATGNSCIFLGYQAGYSEAGNNKLYIENSNSATPLIYGEFDTDTVTLNTEICNITLGSDSGDDFIVSTDKLVVEGDTGRVGIGTTSPANTLEIKAATTPYFSSVKTDITSHGGIRFYENATLQAGFLSIGSNFATVNRRNYLEFQSLVAGGGLSFWTTNGGTAERMRIIDSGNVGINTTGPDRKLDVLDATNPQIRGTHTDNTHYFELQADGSGNLYITTSGNTIDIESGDRILLNSSAAAEITFDGANTANIYQSESGQVLFINTNTGALYLGTSDGGQDLTIDTSGNVGIGGTPSKNLHIIDTGFTQVQIDGSTAADLIFYDTGGTADKRRMLMRQADDVFKFFSLNDNESINTDNIFVLDNDTGNVGIGVTDPDTQLEILNAGNQLKLSFDGTDNAVFAVDTNGDLTITVSGDEILVADVVRGTTSLWYNEYHLGASQTSPGASGATAVELNAVFSWNLDAITEYLYYAADIHDDWDAATDVEIEVTGYLGEAETANDLIRMSVLCGYGTDHDNANTFKTQTLDVDHDIVSDNAQFDVHTISFTFNFDEGGNVLEVLDTLHLRVWLDDVTSAPVVTDFNITFVTIKYKSAQVRIEVD